MVSIKNMPHDAFVLRPRAPKAAYVLSGATCVAGIQAVLGGELRSDATGTAARTDVFVPGLQPGGHPA
jgi:hypothetical protein